MKIGLTRKFMAMFFTLCMAISFVPIPAFAENSAVSNATQLEAALEDANRAEIKLGGNIELSTGLDVERAVTLDLNGYTLSCSLTDEDIFTIRSNGNLTVKDSGTGGKIDGQNKNCGFNVKGGILTLESGSIVNCTDANGDGGAVDVSNTGVTETPIKYGKFVMNGGAIMDCKASDDGGAVDIGSGCIFVMNGGTIVNCRADDDGGAVFIKQRGNFELNGGLIQNCSAGNNGGAVNIYEDGRFTMTGGTIKSCKVDLGGSGIAVYGKNDEAVVTMTGGTFEDCGVFPYSFDEFTVNFDSDGGSAVPEQKLLNAPAVKPADPKKSGYDFTGWYLEEEKYTFTENVTKDITLKAHWTPTGTPTVIDVVEINDVTVSFKDGDKPVFTGKVPDGADYAYRCEWWELDRKTGAMSTDFGNFYENKFTNFEAGKTYHYGVYVTTIYGDRYVFGPDTKLKINGEFVNYNRYEGDTSDGPDDTMWVITDLTMTPQATGEATEYKVIEGANSSWVQNSDETLTFRIDGDLSKFVGIKVDDEWVDKENYTIASGSTVVTLKNEYLKTLSAGKHKITFVYTDGEVSTNFEVKESGKIYEKSSNPKTGDTSNILVWYSLFAVSALIVFGIIVRNKKKKSIV